MDLTEHLLDEVEAETKARFGIRPPRVDVPPGTTAGPGSMDMSLPADAVAARDRITCDMGNGWADGTTVDRKGQVGDPANVPDLRAQPSAEGGFGWLPLAGGALGGLLAGVLITLFVRRWR